MRLPALDLRAFLVAQIIGEQAALGFHHKVKLLRSVLFNQHGPVRMVAAERSRDFEPAGQLRINLYGWRCAGNPDRAQNEIS